MTALLCLGWFLCCLVLTGVDADSTYCFLLEAVEHRDEDTWGFYLLEAEAKDLILTTPSPMQARVLERDKKLFGEIFLVMGMFGIFSTPGEALCRNLAKKAQGATTSREKLEHSILYWQKWNQLYKQLSVKFLPVKEAVESAMKSTPRASSLVENLNSRSLKLLFLKKAPEF